MASSTFIHLRREAEGMGYVAPVSFANSCTCGGYAHSMNGRNAMQPHISWCPQYMEYAEYVQAMRDFIEGAQK